MPQVLQCWTGTAAAPLLHTQGHGCVTYNYAILEVFVLEIACVTDQWIEGGQGTKIDA